MKSSKDHEANKGDRGEKIIQLWENIENLYFVEFKRDNG